MAYQYYQSALPGWGRSKVHFGVPPIPNIRPQPSWTGLDYYSAHGIGADPDTYYRLLNRVHSARGSAGYSQSEAKDWHRRIYGGLSDLTRAMPSDIGAAAAYEAYRMWKHHRRTLYEYLRDDRERETEGLIGLAAAEATHLWHYAGRPMDTYSLREVLEYAALTASNIAYRVIDEGRGFRLFGGLSSRRSSVSSGEDYTRGYQRHRRHSSLGPAPPIVMGRAASNSYGTPYTNSIPMPGGSPYSNPIAIPGRGSPYSNPIPIPGQESAYGGGLAVSSGSYHHHHSGLPGSYGGSAYQPTMHGTPRSYGGTSVLPSGSAYGGAGSAYGSAGSAYGGHHYPTNGYSQSQGQSYTIQGSQFPGGAVTLPSVAPGSTIIIHQPTKRSRHHSMSGHRHHHSHHRSLSSDKRVAFI